MGESARSRRAMQPLGAPWIRRHPPAPAGANVSRLRGMQQPKPAPLVSRTLLFVMMAMALSEASRTMILVQVPVFLRELGADISQIGLFFTIAYVFPLALQIVGGWFSDRAGRLLTISIGSLAGVFGFVPYILAPTWQVALLGPALLAITEVLNRPSYRAYIADTAGAGVRGRVFGLADTVVTFAWILGPPVGGFLGENFGYRTMFAVALVTQWLAAWVFLGLTVYERFRGEAAARRGPPGISLKKSMGEMIAILLSGGLVTWMLITDGVRDITIRLSFDLMPVYLSDIAGLSRQQIGFLDGMFGVCLALAGYPAGWLVDKTSQRTGIVLGMLGAATSVVVFAFAAGFWGFGLSWGLLGLGMGLMRPAYGSLIAEAVPQHLRGMALGLLVTSLGVFSLPSPWIGAQIWQFAGPRAPFLASGVLSALAILPAWFKLRVPGPHPTAPAAGVARPVVGGKTE